MPVSRHLDDRQGERAGVGNRGEAHVGRLVPLHGRAHRVAVIQPDVLAHADLIAVVQARRARQRQQQRHGELGLGPRGVQQGRQAPADADVGAHAVLGGVPLVHHGALVVGDHLQGQLVVVAQEGAPLAVGRDVRGGGQDVSHRPRGALAQGVVDPRHDREVEAHGALGDLGGAEVVHDVDRPLVGLRQGDRAGELLVEHLADTGDDGVRVGQVLAARPLALGQVGDGVQAEAVHPGARPEADDVVHGLDDGGVVVVEVGLVGEEPVPEELAALDVVGPVRLLGVDEDDPGAGVAGVVVGPHVEVAERALGVAARGLEPGVDVRGVVEDHVDDDADAALVGLVHQVAEVLHGAVARVDVRVVGDVVAAVAHGGGVEGRDPDRVHAQPRQVVQTGGQPLEVPDAVAVGVREGAQQRLVEDGGAEPLRVRRQARPGLGRQFGDAWDERGGEGPPRHGGHARYAGDRRCCGRGVGAETGSDA